MLKFLRCCFYLSVSMCASALGKTSQEVEYPGIIAYVDEEIILQQDLNERINIIKMSVGGRYDSGMDKTALNELVLEKIRWHLLKKYAPPKGWTDPREIEEIYESIAKQNNLSSDKFTVVLQKQNIDAKNFKHSIEVNLAWNRYIEARYGSGINISQHELTEIKKGIETRKNQPAFYLSRIYIPADDQTFKQASDEVHQIMRMLDRGASFADLARRYSHSPDAKEGGDLGWVSQGELSPDEAKVLPTMSIGKSAVVKTNNGYFILYLKDKKEAGQDYSVSVEFVQIAVPRPELAGGQDTRQLLLNLKNQSSNIAQLMQSAKNIGCFVSPSVKMQLEAISPEYREMIRSTNEGKSSSIGSNEQALFIFCVLKKMKRKIPEKTENQLKQDHVNIQLARCSAQSLRELKLKAHIRYSEQGLKILSQN